MKRVALIALLLTIPAFSQTRADVHRDYVEADRDLNAAYKTLMTQLDGPSKPLLLKSEQAWIHFRDSEAAARAGIHLGGTQYGMYLELATTDITRARTKELREWSKSLK